MDIEFNRPNFSYVSNKIKRTSGIIFLLPFLTIKRYFFWNYENLYFLALSLFQLLTIGPLPSEWSPTGPYSTILPLIFCVVLEIVTDIYTWINNWLIDYHDNNKQIDYYNDKLELVKIKSMYLRPGNIIKLYKDDIVPVDGILLDHSPKSKYGRISLSPLNGESNIHYIEKPDNLPSFDNLIGSYISINNYLPTNFYEIEGSIMVKNKKINIDSCSFVVANSIVKSDEITLWSIRCGNERKSYSKTNSEDYFKKSRLDSHIANYMINYNTYLLMFLIIVMSSIKFIVYSLNNTFNPYILLFYSVQNWILFNGIIPFSAKILLILAKKIEAYMLNRYSDIRVLNSQLIDDIPKIDTIETDKTGTLTKNKLEFCKIIQKGDINIIDVENVNDKNIDNELLKCLGLCIHQTEGNFSTVEDKTIRSRYSYLDSNVVQYGDIITINFHNREYTYQYIEVAGLDFTYDRKLSSKIVKDNESGKYYIYSKGSIDAIRQRLINIDVFELNRLDGNISIEHPELRLLACAFREVSEEELQHRISDSLHSSIFVSQLEHNLHILGIVGIKDNLQKDVCNTINKLSTIGIYTSMCTGDRKITALAVSREAGIITDNNIIDYDIHDLNTNTTNSTIAISGNMLQDILHDENKLNTFSNNLKQCKNFVAYNLIPSHKKVLVDILENNNVKILTIGDGFNDIDMFKRSSISVSIDGSDYVVSNSDFCIKEFRKLWDLVFKIGTNYYNKNTLIGNYTFYRSVAVVITLITYNLIHFKKATVSILNGFVLQAFNFLWCIIPLIYQSLMINYNKEVKNKEIDIFKIAKYTYYSNNNNTTIWNFNGLLTGIIVTLYTYLYFNNHTHFSDILGLLLIFTVNFKFLHYGYTHLIDILIILTGPISFILYTIYSGSFLSIIKTFTNIYNLESLSLLSIALLILNFFIK